MEGDDAGCNDLPVSDQGDMTQQLADLNDSRQMSLLGRDCQIDHSDAPSRKHLFEHSKGDDNILLVGETLDCVREKFLLIKAHIDPIVVQHEDERDRFSNLPHQHLQSGVV